MEEKQQWEAVSLSLEMSKELVFRPVIGQILHFGALSGWHWKGFHFYQHYTKGVTSSMYLSKKNEKWGILWNGGAECGK